MRCRASEITGSWTLLKRLLLGCRLADITFSRLRVAARSRVLALIGGPATPARLLIGDRLGPVAF